MKKHSSKQKSCCQTKSLLRQHWLPCSLGAIETCGRALTYSFVNEWLCKSSLVQQSVNVLLHNDVICIRP